MDISDVMAALGGDDYAIGENGEIYILSKGECIAVLERDNRDGKHSPAYFNYNRVSSGVSDRRSAS